MNRMRDDKTDDLSIIGHYLSQICTDVCSFKTKLTLKRWTYKIDTVLSRIVFNLHIVFSSLNSNYKYNSNNNK